MGPYSTSRATCWRSEAGTDSMGFQSDIQECLQLSSDRGTSFCQALLQSWQRSLLPLSSWHEQTHACSAERHPGHPSQLRQYRRTHVRSLRNRFRLQLMFCVCNHTKGELHLPFSIWSGLFWEISWRRNKKMNDFLTNICLIGINSLHLQHEWRNKRDIPLRRVRIVLC